MKKSDSPTGYIVGGLLSFPFFYAIFMNLHANEMTTVGAYMGVAVLAACASAFWPFVWITLFLFWLGSIPV